MKTVNASNTRKKTRRSYSNSLGIIAVIALLAGMFCAISATVMVGSADNFTDIFYTNSFRGAFEWFKKLDWVGMLVQAVISIFSLFGVALLVIRIMTSMLYLSAKGMWEEVHDLKSGGGEAEKDLFGMLGMAKSWASGKAGSGLDAIIGAVLMLLPDVKKYSDFGEKAGGDFTDDMTISQYMLKIALPTVMTVFFFAMGFNGTLFQALAVTVDAMGTVADRAISINYSGMIDDLVNSGTGYKFVFGSSGTETGDFQQQVAKDVYGRAVSQVSNPNAEQLYYIGQQVESWVSTNVTPTGDAIIASTQISEKVRNGLTAGNDTSDRYMSYLGYDIVINGSDAGTGAVVVNLNEFLPQSITDAQAEGYRDQYLHLFIRQTTDFNGNYFNLDN